MHRLQSSRVVELTEPVSKVASPVYETAFGYSSVSTLEYFLSYGKYELPMPTAPPPYKLLVTLIVFDASVLKCM
jgi:hypothetical protein